MCPYFRWFFFLFKLCTVKTIRSSEFHVRILFKMCNVGKVINWPVHNVMKISMQRFGNFIQTCTCINLIFKFGGKFKRFIHILLNWLGFKNKEWNQLFEAYYGAYVFHCPPHSIHREAWLFRCMCRACGVLNLPTTLLSILQTRNQRGGGGGSAALELKPLSRQSKYTLHVRVRHIYIYINFTRRQHCVHI